MRIIDSRVPVLLGVQGGVSEIQCNFTKRKWYYNSHSRAAPGSTKAADLWRHRLDSGKVQHFRALGQLLHEAESSPSVWHKSSAQGVQESRGGLLLLHTDLVLSIDQASPALVV